MLQKLFSPIATFFKWLGVLLSNSNAASSSRLVMVMVVSHALYFMSYCILKDGKFPEIPYSTMQLYALLVGIPYIAAKLADALVQMVEKWKGTGPIETAPNGPAAPPLSPDYKP